MEFKRYPKIHRLGKEETDGVLVGKCSVQEKIDGANTSVWYNNGKISVGSRNQQLSGDVDNHVEVGTFNGFVDYVREHDGIRKLLADHPEWRLYGEWLVRHTISYNETAYKQFYLFDIEIEDGVYLSTDDVSNTAVAYGIKTPKNHGTFVDPDESTLKEMVGKSELGDVGEGIVIKNLQFVNAFGDLAYAKIVSESFKENNAITFGGNNKHSESYWEMWITNKYITLPRVQKIMNKIQPEIDKRLDLEHIPHIANSVYHDMLTEEIWEIQKKAQSVNFRVLQRCALKKAIQIYKDILTGDISVADKE